MTTKEAYEQGYNAVRFIACHNLPKLGETYRSDGLGEVTANEDNIQEIHEAMCFEAEMSSRDFTPFEFTAHAFNSSEDADELWEAYDKGVADGIFEQVKTYTIEDYK